MWPDTRLQELLDIEHPLIQAPMAGVSTPAMALAAANAGCLGSLGCAMAPPDALKRQLQEVGQATNRPINFNFFVHTEPDLAGFDPQPMTAALQVEYATAGLGNVPAPKTGASAFSDEVLDILLRSPPKVVSFHFGLPSPHAVTALKDKNVRLLGCATSAIEAKVLQTGGMDAIVAQGSEAGGHRGSFIGDPALNDMGTMALVPLIVDAVTIPVIAAGGIFDGRGIAAAFLLGAAGVQLGTAFMRAPEASTHPLHKRALAKTPDAQTKLTRLFSGRPARSLRNHLVDSLAHLEGQAAPFPTQRALIAPLAKAALEKGSTDFHNLWSGQAGSRAQERATSEIIDGLINETQDLLSR